MPPQPAGGEEGSVGGERRRRAPCTRTLWGATFFLVFILVRVIPGVPYTMGMIAGEGDGRGGDLCCRGGLFLEVHAGVFRLVEFPRELLVGEFGGGGWVERLSHGGQQRYPGVCNVVVRSQFS